MLSLPHFTATKILKESWKLFCALLAFYVSTLVGNTFLNSLIPGNKLWGSVVLCKRRLKSIAQFPVPKPEKQYAKVLNCLIDNCGVKYFCTVAHAEGVWFSKKHDFLKLTICFILTKNRILTKENFIFRKYVKKKLIDAFLDMLTFT